MKAFHSAQGQKLTLIFWIKEQIIYQVEDKKE